MFDTPYESWCANVAFLMQKSPKAAVRGSEEHAVHYLERIFGNYMLTRTFLETDTTPEEFVKELGYGT